MRTLLITPTFFPMPTGNAVTVYRISRELAQGGITCRIVDLSSRPEDVLQNEARKFGPDVIHCFHAWKTGRSGLKLREILGVPMITTVTGTDINVDIADRSKRPALLDVFAGSEQITVFNEPARTLLLQNGIPEAKITVIHQSVFFSRQQKINYRKRLGIESETTVFLLLGSIRRVKNPGYAVRLLEEARKRVPALHLIIAGPVTEPEEFRQLQALIANKNWITYLGEVPRNQVRSLLTESDVLLNTSASESEANAVMEAMSCGKIVIGRNIAGNASLLSEETALSFGSDEECYRHILSVLKGKKDLRELRRRARQRVSTSPFRFADEKEGYLTIYRKMGRTLP